MPSAINQYCTQIIANKRNDQFWCLYILYINCNLIHDSKYILCRSLRGLYLIYFIIVIRANTRQMF